MSALDPNSELQIAASTGERPDLTRARRAVSYLPDIHRMLPQAPESEQGVLASLFLSPEATFELCERFGVESNWFHIPAHAEVFIAIRDILQSKDPSLDFVKLTQLLRDKDKLEAVGGAGFITSLWTFLPTAANAAYYIRVIRHKWRLREMVMVGTELAAKAYDEPGDPDDDGDFELAIEFEARISAVSGGAIKQSANLSNRDLAMKTIAKIQQMYDNKGKITGIATGFTLIDNLTNGLHEEEMTVIAARPGVGKTALAMNIVEHAAFGEEPCAVIMFPMEMSRQQCMDRFIASSARVNMQAVRDGFLSERDFPALTAAAARFAACDHVEMIDTGETGGSIQKIRAIARKKTKEFRKRGFKRVVVIIDYLQLCSSASKKAERGNREGEVSEVSRGCKLMSTELKIPVVVLSQLNRGTAKEKRRPRLTDLRESGSIEQDADNVWLLGRPEMEVDHDDPELGRLRGIAECEIAKQRNGPSKEMVRLTYIKEFTRFENRAEEPELPLGEEKPQSPQPKRGKKYWNR
ncbi:MAG: replicative DNA helicase [Undibacterium sp.]